MLIPFSELKLIAYSDRPLTIEDGEVIGWHYAWKNDYFMDKGFRIGFVATDGNFVSCAWRFDENEERLMPTHYYLLPSR